jgi:hypothetical protein
LGSSLGFTFAPASPFLGERQGAKMDKITVFGVSILAFLAAIAAVGLKLVA